MIKMYLYNTIDEILLIIKKKIAMKKSFYFFAVVAVILITAIVSQNPVSDCRFRSAGSGKGLNLKEANDEIKSNVNVSLAANLTSEQRLAQAVFLADYYRRHNIFFFGGDVIAVGSTEFGFCYPTLDFRTGIVLPKGRAVELKAGTFCRNSITTTDVDPQYANYCTLKGESAKVSNAMQLSFIGNSTKIGIGHQSVASFYAFDGKWYAYMEQNICKNVRVNAGIDFGSEKSGFVAAKWSNNTCGITVTGNLLGTDGQNCLATFTYRNIPVWKKMLMTLSTSFSADKLGRGIHLSMGFAKRNLVFFGELGGRHANNTFSPKIGVGISYKL